MKISYNWLKDYVKSKMPDVKELAELLTFHSFEVEEIIKKGNDWVLDIDVLPNRAGDCLSFIGIAREVAGLVGSKLKEPDAKIKENKDVKANDLLDVNVLDSNDCLRYTAKIIQGVKINESEKWIQERLTACGLQPINNIVDITNYVMLETGQPMHAFDLDKLKNKIIVRRAKAGEKIKALDDKEYQLDKDILVIADEKQPIAIAGIKGGEGTGIDKKTKNIVIEAANFKQALIRTMSQKLKLKTDAGTRFENGIDIHLIDFAQQRVCSMINEMAGGKTASGLVDVSVKKPIAKKIKFNLLYLEKLLGISIPKKQVFKILKNLGFEYSEAGESLLVKIPTRRLDISIQEDLIEEIGRLYGYDKIDAKMPRADLAIPERNEELFWQKNIRNTLKEFGFSEVLNYCFIGEKERDIFAWQEQELAELNNPMSSYYKYMRPSLMPNMLKNVKENYKWFNEIKIFEIGKVFKQQGKIKEKDMLAGIITRKGVKDSGFYEAKGVVETLLSRLGISDIFYDSAEPTPEDSKISIWHPGKMAEIKAGGKEIGFLGAVHPKLTESAGIKENVFMFDLDFNALLNLVREEKEYQEISSYPAVLRDLAILVPAGTKIVQLLNIINQAGGSLIIDVDVFDIYSGQGVEQGRENYAFHIIFQSEDKTLSSKEVDVIMQDIIKAIEEIPEFEVRKQ